jgi:hypothetical protein|tara:strand:+ start:3186 stop:3470 length:285 start_codon:yes stop_codon:yes gene_type:complete
MKFLERYNQEEITKVFYLSGTIIFFVVGFANIFTNFITWDNLISSAKISAVFMNIFNFVIAIFFYSLLKGTDIPTTLKPIEQKDVDKVFKEVTN